MGAANVGAVLLTWHDLPHRARVVLLAMAHMASDTERVEGGRTIRARRYWDGPGYLAEVLYGPVGVAGHDGKGRPIPTPSAARQVEKCLTELVRAGALRRVVKGSVGHRSEYEVITFRPVESPTETVGQSPTETVGEARPKRSVKPDRNGRPQEPLRNQEENRQENIASGEHVQSRATTASDGRDIDGESSGPDVTWRDVPLLPDSDVPLTGIPDLAAAYPDAWAHLERKMGHARAGTAVAALLDVGYASHTEAVIRAALVSGWTP